MSSVAVMVTTIIIHPPSGILAFALLVPLYTSCSGPSDPLNKFRRRSGENLISTCNRETKAQRVHDLLKVLGE